VSGSSRLVLFIVVCALLQNVAARGQPVIIEISAGAAEAWMAFQPAWSANTWARTAPWTRAQAGLVIAPNVEAYVGAFYSGKGFILDQEIDTVRVIRDFVGVYAGAQIALFEGPVQPTGRIDAGVGHIVRAINRRGKWAGDEVLSHEEYSPLDVFVGAAIGVRWWFSRDMSVGITGRYEHGLSNIEGDHVKDGDASFSRALAIGAAISICL
jgi:hypothetical protein